MSDNERGQAEALLLHYWFILRKRKLVVFAFTGFLLLTVSIATTLSTPYYEAEATIEIAPKAPTYFDVQEVAEVVNASSSHEMRTYYATQYKIIQSRTVLNETVRRLEEDHGVTDFQDKEKPWLFLRQHLSLEPVVETQLVKVVFEYPDPELAALMANTLAEAYMDQNLQRSFKATQEAMRFLQDEAEKFRSRKEMAEGEVQAFRSKHDLMGLNEQFDVTSETLSRLQTAWSEAHTERIQVEATYQRMRSLSQQADWRDLATHLSVQSPVLRDLLGRYEVLEQEQARLGARYKAAHPEMVRVQTEMTSVAGQIRGEVDELVGAKRAEFEMVSNREAALQRELDSLKSEVEALDAKLVELRFLEEAAERDDSFYKSLDLRLSEVDISQVLRANNVQFVDTAIAGDVPVRPKLAVNLAMALVFGLFGGCAMAFFMEYLDNTVKSREDIEHLVGVPMLGVVPMIPAEDLGSLPREVDRHIFVHARPRSNAAECLRSIRTNVLFRTPQRKFRTLLITSAAPREGKSFISSNLSTIIAMTGSRVLLIDADLRRPSMHKRFGLSNDMGLSNLLSGEVSLEAVMQETHVKGLDVVPAGPIPPNPGELLGGGRMQRIINSVRNYDMVIVDSPPVNVVADPRVLSSIVDGVVLVVEANRTSRNLVMQASMHLQEMKANVLGAVVNKLDIRRAGYGYYYYDDYGYYYTEAEKERNRVSDAV